MNTHTHRVQLHTGSLYGELRNAWQRANKQTINLGSSELYCRYMLYNYMCQPLSCLRSHPSLVVKHFALSERNRGNTTTVQTNRPNIHATGYLQKHTQNTHTVDLYHNALIIIHEYTHCMQYVFTYDLAHQ